MYHFFISKTVYFFYVSYKLCFFIIKLHQVNLIDYFLLNMKLYNTKIIAISNQKGGVGKTTSSINIAAFLAITETPTLLIDMDPQCNATSGVGVDIGSYKKSIYDVIIGNAKIEDAVKKTDLEFLEIRCK